MPKTLLSLFTLLFILSSCQNEYWSFHDQKNVLANQQEQLVEARESFSVEKIEARNVEILTTPDKKVLDRIVWMIETAKIRVQIETYILTEKRIIAALKDAHKRGVWVQVILEKNVFGGTSINTKTFNELKNAGISVAYANNKLYTYTHTKTLIVDDTYIITTGNLSYASFASNREFYVIGKNTEDMKALLDIFAADFSGNEIMKSTSNLVLSPIDSRTKIETLLASSKKTIFLYAENFGDPKIISILESQVKKGVPVTICMADPSKVSSNTEAITLLKSKWIDARTSKKPTIHAKVALIDSTYSYIGSENFSTNSLDNNREIGIMTRSSSGFVDMFHTSFDHDCPKID